MSTPIDSLLVEREGYARRGLPDRVALVDVELARHGYQVTAPAAVETADVQPAETTRRGPGRPRKVPTED
jgi:hypothetical protein